MAVSVADLRTGEVWPAVVVRIVVGTGEIHVRRDPDDGRLFRVDAGFLNRRDPRV